MRAPGPDALGWGALDGVSVADCAVNRFGLLPDVAGHSTEWAVAVSDVLQLWSDSVAAGDALGVERALKFWLPLPQLFFRMPPRGGRRGSGRLRSRFGAWQDRQLSRLVMWWQADVAAWVAA